MLVAMPFCQSIPKREIALPLDSLELYEMLESLLLTAAIVTLLPEAELKLKLIG
jgi:hypothetical protein